MTPAVLEEQAATNAPGASRRFLVISPVRDEGEYLRRTIDSMVAQTVRPTAWMIVDDGSTDATAEIAQQAVNEHGWIQTLRRSDRGTRKVGGGVIDAFDDGLSQYNLGDFDYVCKLDGDLELPPRYFELLCERFEADPRLGTASGKSWIRVHGRLVWERSSDEMSQGQTKLYRVQCFKEIDGFVGEVMWDGIDCHRCRMLGWKAASFRDPELRFIHLRPMGSSFKSIYTGRLRWGYGQYFMGTHPLYALAIAVYRAFERPWIIGGLLIIAGYVRGYLLRQRRYEDKNFRSFLRFWQLKRLGLPRWMINDQTATAQPASQESL